MGKSTTARTLTVLAVAFASGGCAMKGDIRLVQDEMRELAARQDSILMEIRAQTMQTQDTLRTQTDRMYDLRGDVNRQLQLINETLTRLEAIAGENQRGLAAVRDQLANARLPAGGATTMPQDSTGTTAGGESLPGVQGAGNPDQLWQAAHQQLDRGSFTSASRAFEQFISDYPSDPRVPDAHFFLADILTQQDRPEDALEKFLEIQQLFPTAARVPEALYRAALLQEELGDTDAAKATLERIMNTYPDALVAMLAREKLREIG